MRTCQECGAEFVLGDIDWNQPPIVSLYTRELQWVRKEHCPNDGYHWPLGLGLTKRLGILKVTDIPPVLAMSAATFLFVTLPIWGPLVLLRWIWCESRPKTY